MEPAIDFNSLLPIAAIIIIGIIIFKVAKSLLKGIGFIVVAGLLLYFFQGGTVDGLKKQADKVKAGSVKLYFKNTTIADMKNKFCTPEKAEKFKCRCVITSVHNDLTSRFSASDLAKLDQDDQLRLKEIRQSLRNTRNEIMNCGAQKEGKAFVEKMKWLFESTTENLKEGLEQ